MSEKSRVDTRRLLLRLFVTLALAAPLVGYAWHTLSEALSGRIHAVPILLSFGFLAVAFLLLRWLSAGILRDAGGGK